MIISSRTPEGDPNTCPICLKELRIDPSTVPIRDAPCPHCGHLLRFDGQSGIDELFILPKQAIFSTSFEREVLGVGAAKLGAFPLKLRDRLLETVALLALKHRLPDKSDLVRIVEAAANWPDVICSLRRNLEFENSVESTRPPQLTLREVVQNFFAKLVSGKGS